MSSVEQLWKDRWRARWRGSGSRQKAKMFKHKDFAAKWMPAQGHLKPSTRATYESILSEHVFPRGVDSAIEGGTRRRRRLGLRPTQLRSVSGDRAICASSVLAAAGPRGEDQQDPPEPSY